MRTKIFEIPNKLLMEWEPSARAMVDTWTTYSVSLEEFKEAILVKGVDHARANNAQAWIIDSHAAKGVFNPEIQNLITTDVLPTFAKIGIKYFMTINAEVALTNLAVNQYSSQAGPHGMNLLKGSSATGAIEWLKENS